MQSQLGVYNATVLYQNEKFSIEKYLNTNTNQFSICVVREQTWTEWVMIYEPGRVAYDNPYVLPQYIRDKVKRFSIFLNADSLSFLFLSDAKRFQRNKQKQGYTTKLEIHAGISNPHSIVYYVKLNHPTKPCQYGI